MNNKVHRTETETTLISFDPLEGFMRISFKGEVAMELEHAIADMEASEKLVADMEEAEVIVSGMKLPVVSDTRGVISDTPEVRSFFSDPESSRNIKAMGLVVRSLPMRLIGNFFIRVNKPNYPCKMFHKMEDAERWIIQYVDAESLSPAGLAHD